jgi:hypothetical protein
MKKPEIELCRIVETACFSVCLACPSFDILEHLLKPWHKKYFGWRVCKIDGDPERHGEYLTIVNGNLEVQNYYGLWDYHECAITTHWFPIPDRAAST